MRDHVAVLLTAIALTACGSGGGGGTDDALPAMPGDERVSLQQPSTPATTSSTSTSTHVQETTTSSSSTSVPSTSPYNFGAWSSYNPGHYRVEETSWSESSSQWAVHGTPSGSVDNLPQGADGQRFIYEGAAWGRIYGGRADHIGGPTADINDGDRAYGSMRAYYYTRDREYRKDDYLHISLSRMFKELPGDGIIGVYWMNFTGDVGTNKHAQGYDSALDLATFTLKPQQYPSTTGRELGELEGSFYGANGEAIAGTFWYIRGGERVEGAFGGER